MLRVLASIVALLAASITASEATAGQNVEGTHFVWVQYDSSPGCKFVGARDGKGPLVLGRRDRIAMAIGGKKACPKSLALDKGVRVIRVEAYSVDRFVFKGVTSMGRRYLFIWRQPGKYRMRSYKPKEY